MTTNHLLSASLFSELFRHNLVSDDGRIIANEKQLQEYSTFLIQQSKDRVTSLYAERKNMVNDVEELLRLDFRTEEEEKLLKELINELDLKYENDGLLSLKEPKKQQKLYLGPKEPKKSNLEKKIEAELKSVKVLKRDLRQLDDWLEQISRFNRMSEEEESLVDWKEAGKKYRQRTKNRMCDMENARMKLIKRHYNDYDKTLKMVLNRKLQKEKYLRRKPASETKNGVAALKNEMESQNGIDTEEEVVTATVQEDAEIKTVNRAKGELINAEDERRALEEGNRDLATQSQHDINNRNAACETGNAEIEREGGAKDEELGTEIVKDAYKEGRETSPEDDPDNKDMTSSQSDAKAAVEPMDAVQNDAEIKILDSAQDEDLATEANGEEEGNKNATTEKNESGG